MGGWEYDQNIIGVAMEDSTPGLTSVFTDDLMSINPVGGEIQLLSNIEGVVCNWKQGQITIKHVGGSKMSLYQVAVVEESNEGIEAILYWTPRPIIARTAEEAKTKILLENAAEIERAQNDDRELSIAWEVKVYAVPFG